MKTRGHISVTGQQGLIVLTGSWNEQRVGEPFVDVKPRRTELVEGWLVIGRAP